MVNKKIHFPFIYFLNLKNHNRKLILDPILQNIVMLINFLLLTKSLASVIIIFLTTLFIELLGSNPAVVRFASKVKFHIEKRSGEDKLYVPIVEIEYTEKRWDAIESDEKYHI